MIQQEKSVRPLVLIDDDEIAHFLFRTLIKTHKPDLPFACFSAPFEVLDLIALNRFEASAIILDINMPKMNGWEFLKKIETLNYNAPVYILSSSDDAQDLKQAKEFKNVWDYFIKPLTLQQLTDVLDKHFAHK
jgi:two-component SAPR family response regulator